MEVVEISLTKRAICHALGVRLLSGGIGSRDAEEKFATIIEKGLLKIDAQNGHGDGVVPREMELAFFYLTLDPEKIGPVGRRAVTLFATHMATAEIAAKVNDARAIIFDDARQIGLAVPLPLPRKSSP